MEKRLITLSDGNGMGDELYIFETDAPVERLKELEKVSCDAYINGNGYDDVPHWASVLKSEGYAFDFVDSHAHINQWNSSGIWLENEYPKITEHYEIDNQPELSKK